MDIKDWIKPEYFKFVIAGIALVILGRSVKSLIFDTPLAYFNQFESQPTLSDVLSVDVPMAVMTILWPVVFAFANLIHENLRFIILC